ncbi:hypothetical protein C8J56DRAFT_886652 [Mycena floridula]|nr:hypothetical protein C8J56DRAFT_886652 [Mycena floridula]
MVCHFSILLLSFTAFLLGFGYSPLSKPDTPSLDNLDDFSFINPLLSLSPSEQSRRQSNIRSLTVRLEIAVHLAPHFNADAGRIRQYRELDALFPFGNVPDMSGALQPISQLMLWLSIIIEHPALVNASSELQELADYAGTCCGSSAWHEEFYRRPMVTPSEPETTPPPLPADPVPEDCGNTRGVSKSDCQGGRMTSVILLLIYEQLSTLGILVGCPDRSAIILVSANDIGQSSGHVILMTMVRLELRLCSINVPAVKEMPNCPVCSGGLSSNSTHASTLDPITPAQRALAATVSRNLNNQISTSTTFNSLVIDHFQLEDASPIPQDTRVAIPTRGYHGNNRGSSHRNTRSSHHSRDNQPGPSSRHHQGPSDRGGALNRSWRRNGRSGHDDEPGSASGHPHIFGALLLS